MLRRIGYALVTMTKPNGDRANDPRKTDDGPTRPAIMRGEGVTDSERYLVRLGERSFLNLWCYPNVFINKRSGGKGDGKELCDLLVVCGDHVLIFSDKTVAWPAGDDVHLAWSRWYRRAIQKSVDQIRGAQRWTSEYPDRLFIDRACTQRLPLSMPPRERMKVHGIVVANGAARACRTYFKGGSGSLMIVPSIQGAAHHNHDPVQPFAVGDVDPGGPFVHIFDEATLDIVIGEFDTIVDLTSYLSKKEALIRSGQLVSATGEEELVAQYMIRMNAQGEHDFMKPDGSPWGDTEHVSYDSGTYAELTTNPQYVAKKAADEVSYAWDRLITLFTDNMLAGTSLVPDGQTTDLAAQEVPVRHMALLSRFLRRIYGAFVLGALEEGQKADKFMRFFQPRPDHPATDVGFFVVTVKIPTFELKGGYQQYRTVRQRFLEAYALVLLRKNPQLRGLVGIATEPKPPKGENLGSSEDLIYIEQPEWTDDLLSRLDEAKQKFSIDQPGNTQLRAVSAKEYPEVHIARGSLREHSKLNRRERRAREAERRRRERKGR
jgi:hypothetical protein